MSDMPKPKFKTALERQLYEALWLVWNRWNVMDGPSTKIISEKCEAAFAKAEGVK